MLSNLDVFENFYESVKQSDDIWEIIKEFGGNNIYVPSYKSTKQRTDIVEDYMLLRSQNHSNKNIIMQLSQKYALSSMQIYAITKHLREPSLFNFQGGDLAP